LPRETVGRRLRPGQAQEGSGFVEDVAHAVDVPVHGEQIEQIAILAGGSAAGIL
jgi:hypothetical protein